MKVVIAEDETLAREHLHRMLRELGVDVVAACSNGVELQAAIAEHRPEAVFVDVEMPELGGMEALATIPSARRPAAVFVTAFDEFAVRAFELEAVDYVLKPFNRQRIAQAVERLVRGGYSTSKPGVSPGERFLVLSSGSMTVILEEEVEYFEAAGNYVRIHAGSRHPLVRETLRAVEGRVAPEVFIRTHRSFLVRVALIRELRIVADGDYEAVLRSGAAVPVSRTWRDAVSAAMA